ncbi:hypothetical protein Tco_0790344 [Tanacetum coccineum]
MGDLWVEEVISVKGVPWVGDGGVSGVSLSVVSSSMIKMVRWCNQENCRSLVYSLGMVVSRWVLWCVSSELAGGVFMVLVSGIVVGIVPNKITRPAGVPTLSSDESKEIR